MNKLPGLGSLVNTHTVICPDIGGLDGITHTAGRNDHKVSHAFTQVGPIQRLQRQVKSIRRPQAPAIENFKYKIMAYQ